MVCDWLCCCGCELCFLTCRLWWLGLGCYLSFCLLLRVLWFGLLIWFNLDVFWRFATLVLGCVCYWCWFCDFVILLRLALGLYGFLTLVVDILRVCLLCVVDGLSCLRGYFMVFGLVASDWLLNLCVLMFVNYLIWFILAVDLFALLGYFSCLFNLYSCCFWLFAYVIDLFDYYLVCFVGIYCSTGCGLWVSRWVCLLFDCFGGILLVLVVGRTWFAEFVSLLLFVACFL